MSCLNLEEADAPYRIRNYTGFDLRVWADVEVEENGPAAKLGDGEEYPWRFEDATTMRQNSPQRVMQAWWASLEGSGFDSINHIPVIREGETLYNLKPKRTKILHQLLVEVKLGLDNVKYITSGLHCYWRTTRRYLLSWEFSALRMAICLKSRRLTG